MSDESLKSQFSSGKSSVTSRSGKIYTAKANLGGRSNESVSIAYSDLTPIAAGSFGTVYSAKLCDSQETVAIKRVFQDTMFKNRELEIMKSLNHCNIVELKYYFYENFGANTYLYLVMEFVPQTLSKLIRQYRKSKQSFPLIFTKVFAYQLMRCLMYLHSMDICHRDLKPQNILVYTETCQLKVCDFGSSKKLIKGENNVSYIASRYYRAPELILGSVKYTTRIDIWSAGCIIAETIYGKPLFCAPAGATTTELMFIRMVKILGTPTVDDMRSMNAKNIPDTGLPRQDPTPLKSVLGWRTTEDFVDFLGKIFRWDPESRLTAVTACCHNFFDQLRKSGTRLPNGKPLPPLFNLSEYEQSIDPFHNSILMPNWTRTL